MCDAIPFPNFSQTQFNAIGVKAAQAGASFTGNSGYAVYKSITVKYDYNPATEILTLECTAKPMFYPCKLVNKKLLELVTEAP